MGLDDETVQALARHCRLDWTPAQVADHRERLAPLVAHLDSLAALELGDVPVFSHPAAPAELRDDTPGPALSADVALAGAATRRGDHVVVPRSPREPTSRPWPDGPPGA